MDTKKTLVVVLNDLFFRVKIEAPAKQAGWQVTFAGTTDEAMAKARLQPTLAIIDLNGGSYDAIDLIRMLKSDEQTRAVPLVAFVSHVQVELRQKALEAGCEQVVARSVLAQELPEILRSHL